ncbi:DNA-directed DNA polymerase, partial [Actinomyces succiniciruminis]
MTSLTPAASVSPPAPEPRGLRLVAVWTPDWPVVALTLESRERPDVPDPALVPVAVVGGRGVIAASAPARAAGVARGMRLRVARSLCPELVVLPPQPEREARTYETVMEALTEFLADPLVARPGLALSA